jgi:hypothetical protein
MCTHPKINTKKIHYTTQTLKHTTQLKNEIWYLLQRSNAKEEKKGKHDVMIQHKRKNVKKIEDEEETRGKNN